MAAQAAAFNTYELVENIMNHLPIFDLLRSTTVSRTWQRIFERSKKTRALLFETSLPGTSALVDGRVVNWSRGTPWVLRVKTYKDIDVNGEIFLLQTATERRIVFAPEDPGQDMIPSGIRAMVESTGWHWQVNWYRTGDVGPGHILGRSIEHCERPVTFIFFKFLAVFYDNGRLLQLRHIYLRESKRPLARVFG